jgi:hypothetical protein
MGSFTVLRFPALTLLLVCGLAGLRPGSAVAQEPVPVTNQPGYDAPAHIALVEGAAMLERDGETDNSPLNMPLLAGDRLRTRAGRVEVLFADGSTLHLDHNSVIDLQSDDLVRLIDGRMRLSIPGPSRDVRYRIDGPHGWVTITEPGDYRLALMNGPRGSELELAVLRGNAELANEGGQTPLRAGERAFVKAGAAPSYAFVANSAAWDAFDRWSEARRDERLRATTTYLPDEVRPYAAALEQNGDWGSEASYGAVWYPRVQSDWRPYYSGRWVSLRPYGWTWVAYDPWGWPTHHYGRWGHSTRGWFWIPGRTWGAAWVSWAYGNDYVSWCPLGWNNRPVFGLNININIGHGYYDPWRAWTVLPRRHFGVGYVHRYVVRGDHLDYRTRSAFVYRDRAPEWGGGRAVPRASAPIRVAGTRDGRRGAAPVYTNVPQERSRVNAEGQRVRIPTGAESRAAESPVTSGARPSGRDAGPAGEGARAVPRERMTPSGPAVRSQRSVSPARTEAPPARVETPSRYEVPVYRGGVRTVESPGTDRPSGARPSDRPASADGGYRAVPRSGSPRETRVDPPAAAPSSAPVYGRAPRGEYSRPSGEDRRPSGVNRDAGTPTRGPGVVDRPNRAGGDGPSRPSPGSYGARPGGGSTPPARAEQPSRSGGGSPPAGARPRSGGGRGGR